MQKDFLTDNERMESESEKYAMELRVLNPTFTNWTECDNKHVYEFISFFQDGVTDDFKGIVSQMTMKELNDDLKE